jgi:hypothetical protein
MLSLLSLSLSVSLSLNSEFNILIMLSLKSSQCLVCMHARVGSSALKQHTSAHASIRQHTSDAVSIRVGEARRFFACMHALVGLSTRITLARRTRQSGLC